MVWSRSSWRGLNTSSKRAIIKGAKPPRDVKNHNMAQYRVRHTSSKRYPEQRGFTIRFKLKADNAKEICVFDGSSLHSHTGKVWTLQCVETCIGYLEKNSSPQAILKLLGKKQRAVRPWWQQCLCCLTCLCLCNSQCDSVVVDWRMWTGFLVPFATEFVQPYCD